jgi:hypothetical protein
MGLKKPTFSIFLSNISMTPRLTSDLPLLASVAVM